MAADSWSTDSMYHATVIDYIFGESALVKISIGDSGKASFTFSCESLDADEYIREFESGTLQVTDCKALFSSHSRIFGGVRALRRRDETSWVSRSWVEGVDSKGNKVR